MSTVLGIIPILGVSVGAAVITILIILAVICQIRNTRKKIIKTPLLNAVQNSDTRPLTVAPVDDNSPSTTPETTHTPPEDTHLITTSPAAVMSMPPQALYAQRVMDVHDHPHAEMGPIMGVMNCPLMSIDDATRPLEKLYSSAHGHNPMATAVYCAKAHAAKVLRAGSDDHDLTRCEIASLHLYTQQVLYSQLNKLMRDRDRHKLLRYFPLLRLMLSALDKLPNHAGIVYRGIKVTKTLKNKYHIDRELTWWSFSSFTLDGDSLSGDTFCGSRGERILFTVRVKTGKDISVYSAYRSEKEILLPPGRVFKVEGGITSPSDPHLSIIHLDEQILPTGVKLVT